MKKEELLKEKMTFDEIAEIFAANNKWLVPNYANVGRYARKLGYVRMKQMINHKLQYFYVRPEENK